MNQEFFDHVVCRSNGRFSRGLMLFFTVLLWIIPTVAAQPAAPNTRDAYLRAIRPGSSRDDVDRWMATLPKVDDLYVVEGDLLYTEQQVRGFISAQKSLDDPSSKFSTRELLLNQRPDGLPDYYKDLTDRVLTYAIDRGSFGSHYEAIVNGLAQSGSQWMALCPSCGIQFHRRH